MFLVFLCVLTYRNVLDDDLFNDDYSWLYAARHEMKADNVLSYRVVDFLRPLVNLSFYAMEKASFGNVKLHYALNIVLHSICSILTFHLVEMLTKNRRFAIASASLFALSSVHCAAVMWISARTTLLSTALLLASFVTLAGKSQSIFRMVMGGILYALALASKEEAIVGLPIVVALYAISRPNGKPSKLIPKNAVFLFSALSSVYLTLRFLFMGGFLRENWNIGGHALRNLGGAILYQFYPWPFFSIFYPRGSFIAEPSTVAMPELLALPLVFLLLLVAHAAKRSYEMRIALAWAILTMLPTIPFRYRFFSTQSITQSRYYYISSVGTTLALMLLISMLWGTSFKRRAAAIAIFAFLSAGYFMRVQRLEKKWAEYTGYNARIIASIIQESDARGDLARIAVENPPIAPKYLIDAFSLERPTKSLHVVRDSTGAAELAPCLYISFFGQAPKVMRIKALEETGY